MKRIDKGYTPGVTFDSVLPESALFEEGFDKQVETHRHKKQIALTLDDINEILRMTEEVLVIPSMEDK